MSLHGWPQGYSLDNPFRNILQACDKIEKDELHKDVKELIRLCYKHMPEPLMESGGTVSTLCEQIEASMEVLD